MRAAGASQSIDDHLDAVTVVLAADDGYALPLAVAAFSVIAMLAAGRKLQLCILDMGMSRAKRHAVQQTVDQPRVELRWIDSLSDRVRQLPNTWPAITRAGYGRLFIPDVLPESTHRALYLDCDVIARRCVGELFDTDMGGRPAMAVPDSQSPFVCSPSGLPWWYRSGRSAHEPNFNSGVMLMDLDVWRREGLGNAMLTYLTDGRHVVGQDQESINAVIGDRIGLLDPRWNQQSEMFQQQYEVALPYDAGTLAGLRDDPWIVHFSNRPKPWTRGGDHPFAAEWYGHLDRTAFAGWRPSLARDTALRLRRTPRRLASRSKRVVKTALRMH